VKEGKPSHNDNLSDSNHLKRKRDEDTQKDAKLQEYLTVMQRPSKTKTWANDEEITESIGPTTAVAPVDADQPSDEPSQSQKKKQKTDQVKSSSLADGETVRASSRSGIQEKTPNEFPKSDVENQASHEEVEPLAEPSGQDQPQSDADWLRSRTSRLLGLLDDEEQAEHYTHKVPEENERESPVSEQGASETSDIRHPPELEQTVGDRDVDADVALIRSSGRLFLRNLPYDASEVDLEPMFSPFGKIEEVSVTHPLIDLFVAFRPLS
jgi:multiple RNA-binding domain-containing protein 1